MIGRKPKRAPYRHAPVIPAWKRLCRFVGRKLLALSETGEAA